MWVINPKKNWPLWSESTSEDFLIANIECNQVPGTAHHGMWRPGIFLLSAAPSDGQENKAANQKDKGGKQTETGNCFIAFLSAFSIPQGEEQPGQSGEDG